MGVSVSVSVSVYVSVPVSVSLCTPVYLCTSGVFVSVCVVVGVGVGAPCMWVRVCAHTETHTHFFQADLCHAALLRLTRIPIRFLTYVHELTLPNLRIDYSLYFFSDRHLAAAELHR